MATWATLAEVRAAWEDAPLNDPDLQALLDAAQVQCETYAPALSVPLVVPATYKRAVILQTRAQWVASERDGDVIGYGDGFAIRVRPLGQDVKSLLRPPNPRPVGR